APATRALTNSGWQFQGKWAGFSGTVISSNCFITAQHVGGVLGGTFEFQGNSYTATAFTNDPNADIMVWRISGQFPIWAPLYTKRNEQGKNLVVFGRGTQ